jgi:hypothetical protein
VTGVALIGSLGRGEEDDRSDIDLLILANDQFIGQFMKEPAASPWARANLLSDGRHNSPAGATSLGTIHLRSGLPLWVDLHVHPADRTPWPTDSRPILQRRPVTTGTLPFGQLIRFLGRRRDFDDQDPAAQIRALRGIAEDLSSPAREQLGDAVAGYLDLVEATVT